MLLSMTGYGDARGQSANLSFQIEIRSVNNRHFKLMLRAPEPYNLLETEFEKVVRRFVRRGTVLVQLRLERKSRTEDFRINDVALQSYLKQILAVWEGLDSASRPSLESLCSQVLALPGVSAEPAANSAMVDDEWPSLEAGLVEALTKLQKMRVEEGRRMAQELAGNCQEIATHLGMIRERQPMVVPLFRDRIRERVQSLINGAGVAIAETDLLREVALFADRSDISEEAVRLESHLAQFSDILKGNEDSPGRKLEFVAQEMGRESNTIGSKAADVTISRLVVEIKAVLEKCRELLQNVE